MTTYTELKVQSRVNLDNYRATGNHRYLCRAINQTRLAAQLLRAFTPVHIRQAGGPYISHTQLES